MIELKSEKKNYSVVLPTDLKEFTPEVLEALTAGVKLPKWYCIIGMCYNIKLFDIAINTTQKRDQNFTVHPILVKADKEDLKDTNAVVGDKIVIDRSSLERGIHLVIPTMISINNISNFIRDDNALRESLLKGGTGESNIINLSKVTDSKKQSVDRIAERSPSVFVIEFKIVPVSDISASISVDNKIVDPFKKVDITKVN